MGVKGLNRIKASNIDVEVLNQFWCKQFEIVVCIFHLLRINYRICIGKENKEMESEMISPKFHFNLPDT